MEGEAPMAPPGAGGELPGAGGMPPGGGPDVGGMPPDMGGGMPPPEAAGAPPGAEGGMPPGGEGGAPPGAEGGPGGGGGVDEIVNAILDMGYTPEDIMTALQGHEGDAGGAGGAGGPPPGGLETGGMPPEAGPEAGPKIASARRTLSDKEVLYKLASDAQERFRKAQWRMKPVQPGTKEAQDRQELQRYIVEICNQR